MYSFFLGPMLLPVTPEALTVEIGGNNQVVTLINDGEINILHDPQLKEVSFDALLPTSPQKYPFATYGMAGMEALVISEYIKLMQSQKIPFPFIVAKMRTGSLIPVGYEYMQAVIENYTQKEDANNGPDMVVSLKLKEYREYSTIRIDQGANGVMKAIKQRGKSFTSEISKLAKGVGL